MRKQFKDAANFSSALAAPGRRAAAAHPTSFPRRDATPARARYRLVCSRDDDGCVALYVFDPALGRTLLAWRGAAARALLPVTALQPQHGESVTAPCGKQTVHTLMLEAARYAADARATEQRADRIEADRDGDHG